MWKSILIAGTMLTGSIIWLLIDPVSVKMEAEAANLPISFPLHHLTIDMSIETGVMISFFFCFMAMFVNDIGSIESMNALLKPEDRGGRVKRGILITGLLNVASGLLGVIGPVNYSLSPGVITATGCASRITMFPTAALLLILSFSPATLGIIGNIPSVVIGGILIYVLSMQISAGLIMTFESPGGFTVTDGLIIGLPLLLSTVIAFMPAGVLETFPDVLRPVIGNGFVMGVVAALIMEHGLYRSR
ncbi:MAG: putative purine permease YbbY [Syntrophus sp. PtaB.Bin001]|nr:MAG: putative purine permease YbbY [Syntrophus sp. PtaB.Bin001]